MNSKDLTQGSVIKTLVMFFLPVLAGTLLQQLYNAVDGIIVSRYVGTIALAAVTGSSFMIISFVLNFFIALTNGFGVVIAQCFGEGDMDQVKDSIRNGLVFAVLGGIIVGAIMFVITPWMLEILKTPADTMADSILYMRIIFAGMVFITLLNMESAILRALGDSKNPFIYMCISCVINIILDYVFVRYFSWGIAGAAGATVFSQVLNAGLLTWRLLTVKAEFRLNLAEFKNFRFSDKLPEMLKIGLPSGLESNVYTVSNIVVQAGVNSLGTVVVAAWGLTSKLDGVYWATTSAAGVAITNFIGQNYGAGRYDRIRECARKGFVLFTIITIGISSMILLCADKVLYIFTTDVAVHDVTYHIIHYFVPFYFLWTGIEVLIGVMKGIGDAIRPTIITAIGTAVIRIAWMYTAFVAYPTLETIAIVYPITWAVTDLGLYIYYSLSVKKRINFMG